MRILQPHWLALSAIPFAIALIPKSAAPSTPEQQPHLIKKAIHLVGNPPPSAKTDPQSPATLQNLLLRLKPKLLQRSPVETPPTAYLPYPPPPNYSWPPGPHTQYPPSARQAGKATRAPGPRAATPDLRPLLLLLQRRPRSVPRGSYFSRSTSSCVLSPPLFYGRHRHRRRGVEGARPRPRPDARFRRLQRGEHSARMQYLAVPAQERET
ncbi:MAG: hypothetical protein LQ344_000520 [Seirophora lacunosa]|nr:MAG: hypothetical protein LQ344_000520 [Seirophora lacunosa]